MRSKALDSEKSKLKLTPRQRETLIGILLGDAHLETRDKGRTYRLKIEQSARHEAYVRHLKLIFDPWVLTGPRQRTKTSSQGTETISWAFNTVSHAAFRFYAHQFYVDNKKQVPKLIHRWLTPRGMAFWFMDDGSIKSRQSKGVIFNTQGFDTPGVERLIQVLVTKFQLKAKRRHQTDGDQIYVSGESYEHFVRLIDDWVIPEMRYKLPQARRT